MRLIECYIDNFGKLSDERISFSDGLNTICRENGWGKSTLAAFIKAMLYSLEDTRKVSLDENERKRYTPWQGGRFGGSLTIAVGKKRYRIERSFAQKSAEDTFALFDLDTGRQSSDFSERIGLELFGVDADGFERTVFLSEKNLGEKNDNKSISAKLSDLVGTDGDVGVLDDALALLDSRRKFYYKKGGAGEIGRVEAEASALMAEISELDALKITCREEEARIGELEAELKSLRGEREAAEKAKAFSARLAGRDDLQKSLDSATKRIRELDELFKGGRPNAESISKIRQKSAELSQLKATPGFDGAEYDRLRATLGGKADYQKIEEMSLTATRLAGNKAIIDNNSLQSAGVGSAKSNDRKRNTGVGFSLILLAVIFAALAVILGAGVHLYLYALLTPSPFLIAAGVAILSRGGDAYTDSKADEKEALISAIQADEAELSSFLSSFPAIDFTDYRDGVRRVMALYARLSALEAAKNDYDKQLADRAAKSTAIEGEIRQFLDRFGLSSVDEISLLEERMSEYSFLEKQIDQTKLRLSEFNEKYGVELPKPTAAPSDIEARISDCERSIAVLKRQYGADIERLEAEDQKRAMLAEMQERLSTYKNNLSVIQKTSLLLTEAKDALTSRYLGGTKAGFMRYVSEIAGVCGDYTVDTSFTVTTNERGSSKKTEAYSRGTRELYALAMRLALIDSLYENEQPFVVLDDPFVSFDDEKIARSLSLLERIGGDRQVIYLTCSRHRSV